jgi:RNA polymerase sigma-70 factor, ECF subfamily
VDFKMTEQTITANADALIESGWDPILTGIREGKAAEAEELYRRLHPGIQFLAYRKCPERTDDLVQQCFVELIIAIQAGKIEKPDGVAGYARTILLRLISRQIDSHVKQRDREANLDVYDALRDARPDPEQQATASQLTEIIRAVLARMRFQDKEVLFRFYVNGEPAEKICVEMGLTETQFRLLKSRAKDKFAKRAGAVLQLRKPLAHATGSEAAPSRFRMVAAGEGNRSPV